MVIIIAGSVVVSSALSFLADGLSGGTLSALLFGNRNFGKLYSVYRTLLSDYLYPVDSNTLVEGALKGMAQSTNDPYTVYMPPSQATSFHEGLSDQYEGIGAQVEQVGETIVLTPMKGSPAEKAGMRPGDQLVSIDGKPVTGKSVDEVVSKIKGPAGTKVTVGVRRANQPQIIQLTITRAAIPLQSVVTKRYPDQTALVQITQFGEDTGDKLKQQLQTLNKQGLSGLVLDMRGNPGGYLSTVQEIGDLLLPKGAVLYRLVDRDGHEQVARSNGSPLSLHVPIVVLMDGNTASAAEILAAALHDSAQAPLVGTHSFGKGIAQTEETFGDGSSLKYTQLKWLTPKGVWIQGKGLQPDYPVSAPSWASLPPLQKLPLQPNTTGDDVATAQKMLRALGISVDRTDGYFDASTQQAVATFQQRHGLAPTGSVDTQTAMALQDALTQKAKEADPQLDKARQVLAGILGQAHAQGAA